METSYYTIIIDFFETYGMHIFLFILVISLIILHWLFPEPEEEPSVIESNSYKKVSPSSTLPDDGNVLEGLTNPSSVWYSSFHQD